MREHRGAGPGRRGRVPYLCLERRVPRVLGPRGPECLRALGGSVRPRGLRVDRLILPKDLRQEGLALAGGLRQGTLIRRRERLILHGA